MLLDDTDGGADGIMPFGDSAHSLDNPLVSPSSSNSEIVATYVDERVDRMLQRKIDLWPPDEIFALVPTLLRGDQFESCIDVRMEAEGSSKIRARLQHSKSFILNLKRTEQERLSRHWIERLLEAATVSTDEMDQMVFELTATQDGRALLQPVLETLDDMLRRLQDMSPDEKTLTQVVVETIRKRIEAEIKTQDRPFVRLLAVLLRLELPEDRERLLRAELRNSRLVEEFMLFVEEGADFVARLQLGPTSLPDDTASKMRGIVDMLRGFSGGAQPQHSTGDRP